MNFEDYDWERLEGLGFTEESTGELKKACWEGYTAVGMKMKNGKKVPNCVPKKKKKNLSSNHGEKFDLNKPNEMDDMAMGNALPKVPASGPVKNPEMGEQKIRMPRMEVLEKNNANNGHLAMSLPPTTQRSKISTMRFIPWNQTVAWQSINCV